LGVVDGVGQAGELFEAQVAPAVHGDQAGATFGGLGERRTDGGLVVGSAAVDADDDRSGAADLEFAAAGAHHDDRAVPVRDHGGDGGAGVAEQARLAGAKDGAQGARRAFGEHFGGGAVDDLGVDV